MQTSNFKVTMIGLSLFMLGTTSLVPLSATAAEQAGQVLRESISSVDFHEAIIADINIPANASMPQHQHPGDEFLYMVEGEVELSQQGHNPIMLSAGQTYKIPAGLVHTPKAGSTGARAIVFRVHPEGEAITTLIENEQ